MGVTLSGWLLISVLLAVLPAGIASQKGHSGFVWYVYALAILPVAFIHAIFILEETDDKLIESGEVRRCPHCQSLIRTDAAVCKHCSRDVA